MTFDKVEDEGSWILRSSNRTGGNKDEGRKGEESARLANTKVCQRCTKVFRIGKLLPLIY